MRFVLSIALFAASCSHERPSTIDLQPAASPAVTSKPGLAKGLRLVYRVAPSDEPSVKQALDTTRARIARVAPGVPVSVRSEGAMIVVELGGMSSDTFDHVKRATVSRGPFAAAPCADADDVLARLRDREPPPGVHVESESAPLGDGGSGHVTFAWSESSPDPVASREVLVRWVATAAPGVAGVYVGRSTQDGQSVVRTFVIRERPTELGIVEAKAVSESVGPSVQIELDPEGRSTFERFTSRWVKRRVALLLGDEVLVAPIVQSAIGGGHVQISLASGVDQAEADDLAFRLRFAGNGPRLELLKEELFGR